MEPHVVGIREFRANLSEYLFNSDRPVAVTRHGVTVGYFIPAKARQTDLDQAALKEASIRMDAMLARAGFTDKDMDTVSREFSAWRKRKKK